jgi:hypothetical protein
MQIGTGQRLRVTLLRRASVGDTQATDATMNEARLHGHKRFLIVKKVTPMSTVYQGSATEVRPDRFFDLLLDTGETIGLYADDKRIDIEVLP